ncbi:MAG: carboxymuconolactone decarboxylase family protein [Burkholderiaceae bacterium]|nr:carboxymuconolactone decarboxylase family protein [Burkholderiaceae bacterium]
MIESEERMPPIDPDKMDELQRVAAAELIAGPRKAVIGPFIALLRSPRLMQPLQKVGEYLRFESGLAPALRELATLIVARRWTQQFEWCAHVPLALREGISRQTIDALRDGRRPPGLKRDEQVVYEFATELLDHHGVSDPTYEACKSELGERGLIDLVGLLGYFGAVSMVLNVARTPATAAEGVEPLPPLPR